MLNEKKKIRNSNQLNIQRVLATGYTWQGIITASFNLPRAPRTLATDFVHMIEILEPPSYSVQLALCKGTHQKIISHHCFPISSAPGKVDKLTISNSQSFLKKEMCCAVLCSFNLCWGLDTPSACLPACGKFKLSSNLIQPSLLPSIPFHPKSPLTNLTKLRRRMQTGSQWVRQVFLRRRNLKWNLTWLYRNPSGATAGLAD